MARRGKGNAEIRRHVRNIRQVQAWTCACLFYALVRGVKGKAGTKIKLRIPVPAYIRETSIYVLFQSDRFDTEPGVAFIGILVDHFEPDHPALPLFDIDVYRRKSLGSGFYEVPE